MQKFCFHFLPHIHRKFRFHCQCQLGEKTLFGCSKHGESFSDKNLIFQIVRKTSVLVFHSLKLFKTILKKNSIFSQSMVTDTCKKITLPGTPLNTKNKFSGILQIPKPRKTLKFYRFIVSDTSTCRICSILRATDAQPPYPRIIFEPSVSVGRMSQWRQKTEKFQFSQDFQSKYLEN